MILNPISMRVFLFFRSTLILLLVYGLVAVYNPISGAQQRPRNRQLTQPEPEAERHRVALLIGNGHYLHAPPLSNPNNDARDMDVALRSLGFETVLREDQSAEQMRRLITDFGERLKRSGGVGLFYYAGHGIQSNGKNYLIPVEVKGLRENTIEDDAVDVGRILREMEDAGNDINIIILDACRSNPFTRSWRSTESGLAQISAPKGTLIAYAARPGEVADDGEGSNGLYTSELIRFIKQPSITIEEMFRRVRNAVARRSEGKQLPTETTMLLDTFYFARGAGQVPADASVLHGEPSSDPPNAELEFWEKIKNSANPNDFKKYLDLYPRGRFSEQARGRAQSDLKMIRVSPRRGPKANKIVLGYGVSSSFTDLSGVLQVMTDEAVTDMLRNSDELMVPLATSLQGQKLSVTLMPTVSGQDRFQIDGAVLEMTNGRQASARSVPYAIFVEALIYVKDLSPFSGMHISEVRVTLRAFDLETGEVVATENVTGVKGFGNDSSQARINALKEAGQRIPDSFLHKVAESATP